MADFIEFLGSPAGLFVIAGYYAVVVTGERIWYAVRRPGLYDDADGRNNVALNLMNALISIAVGVVVPLSLYFWVYENAALFQIEQVWLGVAIAFFGHELVYYWEHRLGHRVSLFWAFHQVHHSSNEFTFTVAARGCWFDGFMKRFFALPLAFLGVPPVVYFGTEILKNMYGILNHARFVPRLGWLEHVMATPANHRVHHGREAHCIDRNYSQVLIIWDRLFGSFQISGEEPSFGLVKRVHHTNPITTQLHGIAWLKDRIASADSWQDKLRYLWKPPEWTHDGRCTDCPKGSPAAVAV